MGIGMPEVCTSMPVASAVLVARGQQIEVTATAADPGCVVVSGPERGSVRDHAAAEFSDQSVEPLRVSRIVR
jgi:hypothetical protein